MVNLSLRQISSHKPVRILGMTSAVCPICDQVIKLKRPAGLEEFLACPVCHHQLVYFSIAPIVLIPAETLLDDLDTFYDETTFGEYLGPIYEDLKVLTSRRQREVIHG